MDFHSSIFKAEIDPEASSMEDAIEDSKYLEMRDKNDSKKAII